MVSRGWLPRIVKVVAGLRLEFMLEGLNGTLHELDLEVLVRVTVGEQADGCGVTC